MSKGKRIVEVIIRLVIFAGVMLGADILALIMFACGASAGWIIGAMGVVGLVGAALGRRATRPGVGPSRGPAGYGPSAPRKLASRKTEFLG